MPKAKQKSRVDYILLALILVLLTAGLAMLYSASTVVSYKYFDNTSYYFTHQLLYGAGIGLVGLFIASRIDYHFWQKIIPVALVIALAALVMVINPRAGL
jgi:cell division protein FtsW